MSQSIKDAFAGGARSLAHVSSLFIAMLGAVFSYLAYRSHADLGDTAFASSITVLVFLLPAAGIVGSYMWQEANDALKIIVKLEPGETSYLSGIAEDLRKIIDGAKPLQRGFSYTTLAVVLSALSIVVGTEIARALAAISLALLVGTAATVFPMTWLLLQLKPVEDVSQRISDAVGRAHDLSSLDQGKSTNLDNGTSAE